MRNKKNKNRISWLKKGFEMILKKNLKGIKIQKVDKSLQKSIKIKKNYLLKIYLLPECIKNEIRERHRQEESLTGNKMKRKKICRNLNRTNYKIIGSNKRFVSVIGDLKKRSKKMKGKTNRKMID